jgi:hypothetical protein
LKRQSTPPPPAAGPADLGDGLPPVISAFQPAPNPNPTAFLFELENGPAREVVVEIYTKGMMKIHQENLYSAGRGWNTARIPLGVRTDMSNGVYYARIRLGENERDPGKPLFVPFMVIK